MRIQKILNFAVQKQRSLQQPKGAHHGKPTFWLKSSSGGDGKVEKNRCTTSVSVNEGRFANRCSEEWLVMILMEMMMYNG